MDEPEDQPYQYQPIPDANSIRLLHLEPGQKIDAGHCRLQTVSLDDPDLPSFEALSYCWGEAILSHQVSVDGKPLLITQNLAQALVRVRHEIEVRVLWVDAICINQSNIEERTQQVQLMGSIYGKAKEVIIDLGPASEDLPVAVPLILKMFHLSMKEGETGGTARLLEMQYPSAEENERWGLPPFGSPDWDCLVRFFGRAWFQRVWIVQEVRVATSAVVIVGPYSISWIILYIASSWFTMKNYKYLPGNGIFSGHIGTASWPNRIGCHKTSPDSSFRVPLNAIIRIMRPSRASDPRDKIFAFLGLAVETEGSDDLRLRPDYSKSLAHTYRDVSRYLIEVGRSLNILSAVCWVPDTRSPLVWKETILATDDGIETNSTMEWGPPDESVIFPSWVPRWDSPTIAYPLVASPDHGIFYHACGDLPLDILSSADENALILRGLLFDEVTIQSEGLASHKVGYEPHQTSIDQARVEVASRATFYPKRDRDDIFYLTLTTGLVLNQKEAEGNAEHKLNIEAFCEKMPKYKGSAGEGVEDNAGMRSPDKPSHIALPGPIKSSKGSNTDEKMHSQSDIQPYSQPPRGNADIYRHQVQEKSDERRLFVTRKGFMGLGPRGMLPGDSVSILFGGDTPYILRKKEGFWQFVGECYVHGVMRGEAVRDYQGVGEIFEIR